MDNWDMALDVLIKIKPFLMTYLILGIVTTFLIFLIAKIKSLDEISPDWSYTLSTITGFLYFIFTGSLLWFPTFISIFIDRRRNKVKGLKNKRFRLFKNHIRVWFKEIKTQKG